MSDTIHGTGFVVRRMTRSEYMECLEDVILALVDRYGEMSVATVQERVNQAIITWGIDNAARKIREGA